MSRAKFEEWFKDKGYEFTAPHLYDAWLAGRESMRDEAAEECANEWNGDADTHTYSEACNDCADAIRKIEL